MTLSRKMNYSEQGFTFVEVVVVIIILGILVGVVLNGVDNTLDISRHEAAEAELTALSHAIAGDPNKVANGIRSDFGYVGDIGALPTSLNNLISNPGSYSTWNGPYIRDNFIENTNDIKTDPWGATYAYSGGITITSSGSGSTVTKPITGNTTELLSTPVKGVITDRAGYPPGPASDSVDVRIAYPNGTGGMTNTTVNPNSSGYFSFTGIPIGIHQLTAVYTTQNDTAVAIVAVNPRVGATIDEFHFPASYWQTTSGGSGGPTNADSVVLRPYDIGNHTGLTPIGSAQNWQCTDDVSPDDNITYVQGPSGNSWESDYYATEDSPVSSGTIDSVVIWVRWYGSNASHKGKVTLRTNGGDYEGAQVNLGAWTYDSETWSTNPSTGNPWSWSGINAMQIGVSIRNDGRCTQVFAVVHYTN